MRISSLNSIRGRIPTSSYASSHRAVPGFNAVASTHGYATTFLVSALVFAGGGILAAALFPSKARLSALRESVTFAAPSANAEQHAATGPVGEIHTVEA